MDVTTAVVLAAGEGTRLRPLTRNRPKPMLPAANRPILEHVLDTLVEAGLEKVVLVVGYGRDRVQDHFGPTHRGVPLAYVHQEKQLGSGHALLAARDAVSGPIMVVNGDRVIETRMLEAVRSAFETDGEPTLAVIERADAGQYGAVTVENDHLTELVEKPGTDDYRLINAGVYAFPPDVFDAVADTPRRAGELALTDTLVRRLERDRPLRAVRTEGLWADATYPWDLLTVADELLARGRVAEPTQAADVWVADAALVDPAATLRPPVVVSADTEVAAGAVVGPRAALGTNVTVGPNTTVERSVIDNDCRIDAGCTLVDFVAGQDCHIGAGTVVPGGPADVQVDDRVFMDQRLGAVFADQVRAAGDVACAPGTLVGPGASLGVGVRVSGQIVGGAEVVR